jgi:hypothetical protein
MKNNFIYLKYLVCLFLLLNGCSKDIPIEASYPTSDQYLFIEQFKFIYSEIIEGDTVQYINIDFPTYKFDEYSGTLSSNFINFEIDRKLKAIIGTGEGLSGAAGGGSATGLLGIYTIPSTKYNFT